MSRGQPRISGIVYLLQRLVKEWKKWANLAHVKINSD